jgi:hypothetical protein
MAYSEALSIPQSNFRERMKTVLNAELVNILAALLFLLLALFPLYPILAVLTKRKASQGDSKALRRLRWLCGLKVDTKLAIWEAPKG